MRGASGRFLIALLYLLLAASGCERADDAGDQTNPSTSPSQQLPGFVIGHVASRQSAQADAPVPGIDQSDLQTRIAGRFRQSIHDLPMFGDEGSPGPVIDFRIEYGLGVGQADPPGTLGISPETTAGTGSGTGDAAALEPGGAYVVFMFAAEGGAERDPRYQFEIQGLYRERVGPGETPLQAAERLVEGGIADVVEGIRAEAAPRVASDAEVIALLGAAEGPDTLPVIREVHRRRLAAAAPRLRELLASDELELVIAAATALGRVRDSEAVNPLIDLISREHRELTELVLPILGEIGGTEARTYLETVADAHEHPRVRRLAAEVLDTMRAP